MDTLRVLLVATWFGLLAGILEGNIANLLRGVPGFAVRVSPEILWIAPVVNVLLFLLMGLGLAVVFRLKREWASFWLSAGFFSWVTLFCVLLRVGKLNQIASLLLSLGLSVQIARLLRGREGRALAFFSKSIVFLVLGTFCIGTAGAYWTSITERYSVNNLPQPKPGAPNIILITLDTLRADHVSSYGYQRPTTPNLDRAAKGGVLFENAFSNSSWTLPAHASLFTGRLPREHKADWTQPLNNKYPTLAELLSQRGYLTAAFSANMSYVTPEWGLARGFTYFAAHGNSIVESVTTTVYGKKLALNVLPLAGYFDIPGRKRAQHINQELFHWLDKTDGRPFFAFLNYFDPHDPYLTDGKYQKRFSDEVARGDVINFQFQANSFRRKPRLTEQEVQAEIDSYDGCLSYLDVQLGELFAELSRRQIENNTLVIVTSDHGEAFGAHDLFGHGNSLYIESLHVPLIFIWPGKLPGGTRVSQVVSLHDIPATVMELLGDNSSSAIPGNSLARFWSGNQHSDASEFVLSDLSPGRFKDGPPNYPSTNGGQISLVTSQWHFILSESGRAELYAWRDDPDESTNLAESPAGRIMVEEFRQKLNSLTTPVTD